MQTYKNVLAQQASVKLHDYNNFNNTANDNFINTTTAITQ